MMRSRCPRATLAHSIARAAPLSSAGQALPVSDSTYINFFLQ
jgi:hypothetical protein